MCLSAYVKRIFDRSLVMYLYCKYHFQHVLRCIVKYTQSIRSVSTPRRGCMLHKNESIPYCYYSSSPLPRGSSIQWLPVTTPHKQRLNHDIYDDERGYHHEAECHHTDHSTRKGDLCNTWKNMLEFRLSERLLLGVRSA
jgi:hypothetical protein